LIKTHSFEHRLYLIAHLSIVDGVSAYQVLPSELAALYRAFSSGEPSALRPLAIQFGDYAYWQRQWLQGTELTRQVAYWRKQLAGDLPVLKWPTEHLRPPRETFRGGIRSFTLPKVLSAALRELSQQHGVTLFMTLLAAFVSLLYCYTQQDDIIVGTLSPAGRKRSEVEGLLGYFLNPVSLRFDLGCNPTFQALSRQAQHVTLDAICNDDVPVELLAQELKPIGHPGGNPSFDVAISLQPAMPRLDLPWSITSMDVSSGGSPWDWYIAFLEQAGEILARVQYNCDLFDEGAVARVFFDFQKLLVALAANPLVRLSDAKRVLTRSGDRSQRRQSRAVDRGKVSIYD
jgi:hypothetical protein